MSWQGWGLQSQAPDCPGCIWLGPSGTHVLSALCLPFLFRSLMLHLQPGSPAASCSPESPLQYPTPQPPNSLLELSIPFIPECLPKAARFYSHPLLSQVATNSMGHWEGVSWSPGKV